MSNIAKAFASGKAFIPFVTCGDPDLETTAKVVRAMAEAGADLIELGIPFSDPTAEGPVIRRPMSGRWPPVPPPIRSSTWCGTCGRTSPSPWCS